MDGYDECSAVHECQLGAGQSSRISCTAGGEKYLAWPVLAQYVKSAAWGTKSPAASTITKSPVVNVDRDGCPSSRMWASSLGADGVSLDNCGSGDSCAVHAAEVSTYQRLAIATIAELCLPPALEPPC
jgi:hypothetical protein